MEIIECPQCGAKYEINDFHLPVRDKDNIECNYCKTIIVSWNGSKAYSDREISGPTKKY
jgi:predicted Zn finger-like uncharacterized protein